MLNLIEHNIEHEYKLYSYKEIIVNNNEFINGTNIALNRFNNRFGCKIQTEDFSKYNTFSLTAGLPYYYNLYKTLINIFKDYDNTYNTNGLYFASWINYHTTNEVLDWHYHEDSYAHGYISIRPQDTKTLFTGYEIINNVGNIYIGKSVLKSGEFNKHKVEIENNFDEPRITIAFDLLDKNSFTNINKTNLGLIPL